MDVKRFGIVGSGSIGLYYGACLAKAGYEVRFLMRSGFEEAKAQGIRVKSQDQGTFTIAHPEVFTDSSTMGIVDVVIVALKATSNAVLADILPPLVGTHTQILTLQNGLGNDTFLAEQFQASQIMGGLCFVCLTRETPASVVHVGKGTLTIGRYQAPPNKTLNNVAAALRKAGIQTDIANNLSEAQWRKLVWNIPFNGLSIIHGEIGVDQILQTPEYLKQAYALMEETLQIAAALGHPIEKDWITRQIDRTRPMGPYHPSSLIDFSAGRPVEVEAIWGEPLRKAQHVGIQTPHLESLYNQLKETCK